MHSEQHECRACHREFPRRIMRSIPTALEGDVMLCCICVCHAYAADVEYNTKLARSEAKECEEILKARGEWVEYTPKPCAVCGELVSLDVKALPKPPWYCPGCALQYFPTGFLESLRAQ